VNYEKVRTEGAPSAYNDNVLWIRLDKLLVVCGLADSGTDAVRKIKASSVELLKPGEDRGEVWAFPHLQVRYRNEPEIKLTIRVGKKTRVAVLKNFNEN
jgi:hypothetical protein